MKNSSPLLFLVWVLLGLLCIGGLWPLASLVYFWPGIGDNLYLKLELLALFLITPMAGLYLLFRTGKQLLIKKSAPFLIGHPALLCSVAAVAVIVFVILVSTLLNFPK